MLQGGLIALLFMAQSSPSVRPEPRPVPSSAPLALPQPSEPGHKGETTPPRLISLPSVDRFYPRGSLQRGEQGVTILRCSLETTGRLSNCTVHASSGFPELDQAAFRLAQEALYEPMRVNGAPVAIAKANLPVRWVMPD